MKNLIDKLFYKHNLSEHDLKYLIQNIQKKDYDYLFSKAREMRKIYYGNDVYLRGLIEITNYCKNDCYYCGIRRSNSNITRYRMETNQIINSCEYGYNLGIRSFVLQGGEDAFYTDDKLLEIIKSIKCKYPSCALTLSLGERSYESYKKLREAGVDRYLLRHESANEAHYRKLHPKELSLRNRMTCLENLKKLGFQTGCGFMVGSPFQSIDCIVDDLMFIKQFNPEMVGIGPFIPHKDTPFSAEKQGDLYRVLLMLALVRLFLPRVLLPSTTALSTIAENGMELGLLAGANVIMPNITANEYVDNYILYNKMKKNKYSEEKLMELSLRLEKIECKIATSRGDYNKYTNREVELT